jgi:hypothetical protein
VSGGTTSREISISMSSLNSYTMLVMSMTPSAASAAACAAASRSSVDRTKSPGAVNSKSSM